MTSRRDLARIAGTLLTAALLCADATTAQELRVAAASNLRGTIDRVAKEYRAQVDGAPRVTVVYGSTGKLYAQIRQGARFDLFFGADVEHAQRLEVEGLALAGSRFTYSLGRLALWSREGEPGAPRERLVGLDFEHLAIANPRLAPYGQAALEVIRTIEGSADIERRLVYGEDVGKTLHFVESGAAELGFIPLSLLLRHAAARADSAWLVPEELHAPLEQQAVLLTDSNEARSFAEFIRGETSRALFEDRGYAVP